ISAEATDRSRGFLTEGFVRPPVNVDFTFRAPIDIFHIFFDTKVFSKQCCAFAIFFSCHPTDESSFVRVGIYNTKNEEHVHLICASLDKWHQYPREKKNFRNSLSGFVFEGRLRSSHKDALKNVKRLRIRLLRNVGTGGSGLKNVEVWGQIGDLAVAEDREILLKSWQEYLHSVQKKHSSIQKYIPQEITSSQPPENWTTDASYEDIPDEFLDPITCDLMVTPMLLPSGHSVDITTLDKFNAAEMRYNRPPSNPFTGIAFTVDRKPVPNIALKSRIDRYVLLRQRNGNAENHEGTSPSSRKSVLVKSTTAQASSSLSKSSVSAAEETNPSNVFSLTGGNEKFSSGKSCDKPTFRGFSIVNTANINSGSASSTDVVASYRGHQGLPQQISTRPSRTVISKRRFALSRPNAKTTSLNSSSINGPISRELLHSKPNKLTRGDGISAEFQAYSSESLLQSKDQCCKCQSQELLYSLSPCQHIVCRSCITEQNFSSISCPECCTAVHTSQIHKHNSKSVFS
ncbi:U box domain, partial [Trinorchestia longiramus]